MSGPIQLSSSKPHRCVPPWLGSLPSDMPRTTRRSILLSGIVVVVACGPATPSAAPETPAVVEARWGPLAVFRSAAAIAPRNEGLLVVTDRCTFIERDGDREFLAWPADRTTWDPAIASIVFRRFSGEVVAVRNGDRVVLGGGGSSRLEDGLGGAQWASRLAWVVPPALECLVDVRFEVSDVEPPPGR